MSTSDKNSKYTDATWKWLVSFLPDLLKVKWHQQFLLVVGLIQSGKTEFTLAILLMYCLKFKKPCVFLLRPTVRDSICIMKKAKRFADKHIAAMKELGFKKCPTLTTICADEMHLKNKGFEDETLVGYQPFLDIFSGKSNSIIIAINHPDQMNKLHMVMDMISPDFGDFVLAMDEADSLGYHPLKKIKIEGSDEVQYAHLSPISSLHAKIRQRAKYAIGITATALDVLAAEESLTNQNIIAIRPSSITYRGWNSIDRNCLEKSVVFSNDMLTDIFVDDPNMLLYYYNMNQLKPFDSDKYSCLGGIDHPIIILHTSTSFHRHHIEFFKWFQNDPVISEKWVYIREDGTGTYFYSKMLDDIEEITIGGLKSNICMKMKWESKDSNKVLKSYSEIAKHFYFPPIIDTPSILQWFYDNGGSTRFPRIVIKTGDGGRCQSYVSTNGNWHLTHQYYIPPKVLNAADAEQNLRILHDRSDGVPLLFTTTYAALMAINGGHMAQLELMDRLASIKSEIYVPEQLSKEKFSRKKFRLPEKSKLDAKEQNTHFRITLFKRVSNPLQMVSGEDDGIPSKEYSLGECTDVTIKDTPKQDGNYVILDSNKFTKGCQAWKMIEETILLLIDNGIIGEKVKKDWINNKILEIPKWSTKTLDQLNGSLWNGLLENKRLNRTSDLKNDGLLYWKDKNSLYLRYNI